MPRTARTIHLVLAALLVVGLVVQVFLAGLGVFAGSSNFATHRDWGYVLEGLPFFMAVAAWLGGLGRRQILLAAGIFALFLLQSILLLARASVPAIAALHPVNGFLILWLAIDVLRAAWERRTSMAGTPDASSAEASA